MWNLNPRLYSLPACLPLRWTLPPPLPACPQLLWTRSDVTECLYRLLPAHLHNPPAIAWLLISDPQNAPDLQRLALAQVRRGRTRAWGGGGRDPATHPARAPALKPKP